MRLTIVLCLGLIMASNAHGQAGNDPEHVVREIIASGFIDGHDQKVIGQLGDAGAVLLTKILGGRGLTPRIIGGALDVITESFADPRLVQAERDKQPRATLLVLKYLDLSTNDVALKKHVAETRRYVEDRYAASLPATAQ